MSTLKDVMKGNLCCLSCDSSIKQVSELMTSKDVGVIPLYQNDQDNIIGLITDRDIVVKGIAKGKGIDSKVSDIMSTNLVKLPLNSDLQEASKVMNEKQIRRLLVTDEKGKISGIVSLKELALKGSEKHAATALKGVSETR